MDPAGKEGAEGKEGPAGKDGKEGAEGKEGKQGPQGPEGKNAFTEAQLSLFKTLSQFLTFTAGGVAGEHL